MNKFKISKNMISIVGGICLVLLAFVILLAANTPFEFLTNLITHSFGFIGFWLLLPFIAIIGLYLIFQKRLIKIKMGVQLWGCLLVIIALLILTSNWASAGTILNGEYITGKNEVSYFGVPKYLTFSTSMSIFNQIVESYSVKLGPTPKLGGGKVGFVLAGALNSAVTPIGLNVICWVLFFSGVIMVFHRQIAKLIQLIKTKRNVRQNNGFREVSLTMEDTEPESPIKIEEAQVEERPAFDNKPIFDSFHTTPPINNDYDLKKARFTQFEEGNKNLEAYDEEITKATFDPTKPVFEEQSLQTESYNDSIQEQSNEREYSEPFFEPYQDKEEPQEELIGDLTIQKEDSFEEPEPYEEAKPVPVPAPKPKVIKNYIYPSIELLDKAESEADKTANESSCITRPEIINRTLSNLHIGAQVVSYTVGPSVTRFDLKTDDDVSITAVQKYIGDISVRLGGVPVRFEPIVAGKSTSGLEMPNETRTNVGLRESVEGLPKGDKYRLNIPFGKSISGELKYADLADFPHLLIAGTTGSGKSIFVHATILSLIMRNKPDELKLVMVDPKKVEMTYYEDIPHLLCPVISDLRKVLVCFNKLAKEMDDRYELFRVNKVRDIKGYNLLAKSKNLTPIPYIVVFIDEYADLIESFKDVREPVVRLVQKARAAGIHLVIATQRPSVNVIDGVIKANVATRVALMCASPADSMTVIGEGGAEKLLGNGDMLVDCPLLSRSIKTRVQGCYVSETEILRVCDFLREHYQPQFDERFLDLEPVVEEKGFAEAEVTPIDKAKTDEEAYQKIKEDAKHREYFSISYITRTYQMGYSRAGKMFIRLQREGIVAPSGDARGCKVLCYTPGAPSPTTSEQSTFIPDDGTEN